MIQVIFRPPTDRDIEHVAKNMRAIDALECELVRGVGPEEGLRLSIESASWAMAAEAGGETQCIFGVCPDRLSLEDEGFPWMLGANGLCAHAKALLVHSRPFVGRMLAEHERLTNIVHADNAASIRWLKWLGFSFLDAVNVRGHAFLPFEKVRAA